MTYHLSPEAKKDIHDIISYFLTENSAIASDFVDSLDEALELLVLNPKLGHTREDLTDRPVRFWPFKWHYLVIYCEVDPIEIVRVVSGYRDIPSLLGKVEMTLM